MKLLRSFAVMLCIAASLQCCNCQTQENENDMSAKNQVVENIMSRRSIRNYKPEQVEKEKMNTIIECGINAPNAINKQSWEVRVLNTPEAVAKFKTILKEDNPQANPDMVEGCFRGAPAIIVIANDVEFPFSQIDCGIMCQNIMLSAWSMNIGSVCLGSPVGFIKNSAKAMDMLGFSQGYHPIICIGLGYPNESPDAKPRDMSKVKYIE